MKIAVVHGQAHKGNTYNVTHLLLEQLDCEEEDIKEFNVNGISPCVGCTQCILKDENLCPHRDMTEPIIKALEEADVIILDSPNYCMGMSGQLKTFCDHLGYRWMSHRPYDMRQKIGIAISTTAGAGASKTTKAIGNQMIWWSMGRVYQLSFTVMAQKWDEINSKRIKKLNRKVRRLAAKINRTAGKVKPCIKTRVFFKIMTVMHKNAVWSEFENEYWKKNGWIV